MTNREKIENLSPERKANAEKTYSKGVHPLYDYIDWNAWWNSEEPDELKYLRKVKDIVDEKENKYYLLQENIIRNNMEYILLFRCSTNELFYFPQTDDVYELIDSGRTYKLFEEQEPISAFDASEDVADNI